MEGTTRFCTFLETTGARGYVVHLSCVPALKAASDAKKRGVKVSVESVLPHFLLDKTMAERPGVEGMKHVMSPPLRQKHNQQAMWRQAQAAQDDEAAWGWTGGAGQGQENHQLVVERQQRM